MLVVDSAPLLLDLSLPLGLLLSDTVDDVRSARACRYATSGRERLFVTVLKQHLQKHSFKTLFSVFFCFVLFFFCLFSFVVHGKACLTLVTLELAQNYYGKVAYRT